MVHLHGLQLLALIVVLAIASFACACGNHQFGCYGSCTGAATCEDSGGGCQCVGPPTPSPPSNSWRCINGQCQNVAGGIDKGSCLSACDPSKDLYKCINNTCVKNSTGVVKSVCGAVCGRSAAQAVLHGSVSATNATNTRAPAPLPTCSPRKACDFVRELRTARRWQRLSLVCTPEEQCTITGTRLGSGLGVAATLVMENVLVQNFTSDSGGGLLNINRGSVTGTNLTFRNGRAPESDSDNGGCVFNLGTFACTDCVFDKCSAGGVRAVSCLRLPLPSLTLLRRD